MKKMKIVYAVFILLFSVGMAMGAWQFWQQLWEYVEGALSYTDLGDYVILPEVPKSSAEEPAVPSESGEAEEVRTWPEIDFAALQEINQDLVGWIYIEGTGISYPVVQGEDNVYYLDHLFNGGRNKAGCIFLDSRNSADFSDRNSVVYGHHLKSGTMFSEISGYKKQAYYDAHPMMLLMTPDESFEIEIFAGYVAGVEDEAWRIDFLSDSDYERWLNEARERSCFSSDVVPAVTDRVLTLSTCSYEFDNARFVLLGRVKVSNDKR